jgi:hypothetical protein
LEVRLFRVRTREERDRIGEVVTWMLFGDMMKKEKEKEEQEG